MRKKRESRGKRERKIDTQADSPVIGVGAQFQEPEIMNQNQESVTGLTETPTQDHPPPTFFL